MINFCSQSTNFRRIVYQEVLDNGLLVTWNKINCKIIIENLLYYKYHLVYNHIIWIFVWVNHVETIWYKLKYILKWNLGVIWEMKKKKKKIKYTDALVSKCVFWEPKFTHWSLSPKFIFSEIEYNAQTQSAFMYSPNICLRVLIDTCT